MRKLLVLAVMAAVVAALGLLPATQTSATHQAGLMAYWPFDASGTPTADATGHGHGGTVVGPGATFGGGNIAPIPGNVDAIDFDGGGTNADPDYVSVADAATLTPSGSAVTLSAWIYLDTSPTDLRMVAGKWNDGSREYEIMLWSNSKVRFYGYNGALFFAESNTALSTGSWYHVAGVWDGSKLQVYINGAADGSPTAMAGSIPDTPAILTIGAQHWNGVWWRFFDGVIDEVQIYNRALSPHEIAALAACGCSVEFLPPITNDEFSLKDGTALPIHFRLLDVLGNVIAVDLSGDITVRVGWTAPTPGSTYLTPVFDATTSTYNAVFQTKRFNIGVGTATVTVERSGGDVGSISVGVDTVAGTARGNGGKP